MNKTYKLCKENVLTKNLAIIYGFARKYNPYLNSSALATEIGILG